MLKENCLFEYLPIFIEATKGPDFTADIAIDFFNSGHLLVLNYTHKVNMIVPPPPKKLLGLSP